ncbi:luciferase [Halobacteriales archaeon QH_7_65_31]|nr:MAG: luciferase [Halobacteriales archaeon QH_7_65_31]
MLTDQPLAATGLDGVALKPREHDLALAPRLDADILNVDYEGRDAFPDEETLVALAERHDLRVTTPVRADGFDPLGDDSRLPLAAGKRVLVAGNPAYLTEPERERSVAARIGAARDRAPQAWLGTEGIERLAMAAGGPQYELLSRHTRRELRAVRAAGFDGELVLYAPVVLTDDTDERLDAVGGYVSRRGPVRRALPDDAATDSTARGRAREVLTSAIPDFSLVGTPDAINDRISELREIGVDTVVGYPARGLDAFLGDR